MTEIVVLRLETADDTAMPQFVQRRGEAILIPITGSEDLIGAIQGSSVGSTLQLTIQRGGSEQTVSVTVGEQ